MCGSMTGPAERGFTLIEVLVALAVMSLAVLALLNLAGENMRAASATETRAMGAVVAENRAVEDMAAPTPPALGESAGVETAGGRNWRWARSVTVTSDPAVLRIDVRVIPEGESRTVAEVAVFRAAS